MALELVKELFEDKVLTFDDIYRIVAKGNRFGRESAEHRGITVYFSHGINYAVLGKGIQIKEVMTAFDRFLENDFGEFYEQGECPTRGSEYGMYPSSYGTTTATGAIMVHRERGEIIAYFQFER